MKTCNNCDHREVCSNKKVVMPFLADGQQTYECDNWQGWIKCEDEPYPKNESALLFTHLPSIDIYICNNKELPANVDVEIKAWRTMPKYEEENK